MYIGSVSRKGLNHLIYEIVDNAVDEHLAGYCSQIRVTLKRTAPVLWKMTEGEFRWGCMKRACRRNVWCSPLCMPAENFDDSAYKTSGGLHGVGSSVVNGFVGIFWTSGSAGRGISITTGMSGGFP